MYLVVQDVVIRCIYPFYISPRISPTILIAFSTRIES